MKKNQQTKYNPLVQAAIILFSILVGGYFFWNAFENGSVTFGSKSGDFTWSGRPAANLGYAISAVFFGFCIKEIRGLIVALGQKSANVPNPRPNRQTKGNHRGS